jgi:hypothetical protein
LLAVSEVRGYLGRTSSPLEEARSICERRRVKGSLERNPASRVSRSLSENERTKIGAFIATTVTHNPKPMLKMHPFQEGNIRLMKAEINLEGTSAGGCVRICTSVY